MGTLNFPAVADNDAITLVESTITIDGIRYIGIETFKWSTTIDGAEPVYGSSQSSLAETTGVIKCSCEMEINYLQYAKLTSRLPQPYMNSRFNIVINIRAPQAGLSTLIVPSARIIDESGSIERGKNLVVPVKMSVVGQITRDGKLAGMGIATSVSSFSGAGAVTGSVGASFGLSA